MAASPCDIVVLISGTGSNLQALIAASPHGQFTIRAVIANNADAAGLQKAARAGIATAVVHHSHFAARQDFDLALSRCIDSYRPDLLVLAGFMRVLGRDFVDHYRGSLLNVHPSLLPKYRGMQTHQRALEAGEREHGVSVHFVTEELDGGPVIAQRRIPVLATDTEDTLAARVLQQEHLLYPTVVSWYATGRLCLKHDIALLDGKPLPPGGVQMSSNPEDWALQVATSHPPAHRH